MRNISITNNDRWKTVSQACLIAAIFTLVSILTTGYQYGLSNNLFHIPYVLRLAEQSEFQNDVLYNSLASYTSIVWPLLRIVSTEQNIQTVFFTAFVVTRFLTFYAIYFFLKENIESNHKTLGVCTGLIVVAACPWTGGVSIIGGHGLMINYFTQTELTWPCIFFALLYLQRRRFAETGLAIGAVFAINAFVGLWLVWTATLTKFFAKIPVSRKDLIIATLSFLTFAGPIMLWVLLTGNITEGDADFSYVAYARIYNPYHYLIEVSSPSVIFQLLLLFAAGILACTYMRWSMYWISVQISVMLLFATGAALPYMIDNKLVIILHFLRSDGLLQFLSVLLICTTATGLLFSEDPQGKGKALGLFVLVLLVAPYPVHSNLDLTFIVLALLLVNYFTVVKIHSIQSDGISIGVVKSYLDRWHVEVLYGSWTIATIASGGLTSMVVGKIVILGFFLLFLATRFATPSERWLRVLTVSMLITLAGSTASLASRWARQFSYDENSLQSKALKQMTDWIRQSDFHGPFLVKAGDWGDRFQLLARRTVWVDWKQGGAIPWAPHFYQQWFSRYTAVSRLHTPENFLAYARENGIENVILDRDGATCSSDFVFKKRFGNFTFCHLPVAFANPPGHAPTSALRVQ